MRFNLARIMLAVIGVMVMVSTTFSSPANPINYQGWLTDGSGNPISGTFRVRFTIYNAPTGGTALWEEQSEVTVETDGSFTTLLGMTNRFPNEMFIGSQLFLGITVVGSEELSPRTLLATVPTAFYSTNALNAVGAEIATSAPNYVPLAGGTMTGALIHNSSNSIWQSAGNNSLEVLPDYHLLNVFGANGNISATLEGNTAGVLSLNDGKSPQTLTALLTGNETGQETGGGALQLRGPGGNLIKMDASGIGDNSVIIPEASINSSEMLNEPGIAASQDLLNIPVYLPCVGAPIALLTLSITTPAPGYIVVDARCLVLMISVDARGYVQINDTPGGGESEYSSSFDLHLQSASGSQLRYPISTYRIYYKPAGTYTFRLEGAGSWCSAALVDNPMMKATYYPTSYGWVSSMVSSAEAGQFEKAEAVSVPTGPDGKGPATTMYQVDLRELELKAAKLRAETEKAERELAEAKMNEMRKERIQ